METPKPPIGGPTIPAPVPERAAPFAFAEILDIIKAQRRHISVYQNSTQFLDQSSEISLAKISLDRAFAWLGQTMQFLGSKSPYPDSQNPTSDHIEPVVADSSELNLLQNWVILDRTQTARVKDFRSKLQDTIDQITPLMNAVMYNDSRKPALAMEQVFISLTDAKMWLGWELGRIKQVAERMENLSGGAATYQ